MGDGGPCCKNARSKSAQEDKVDAIPDELLGLVFLGLTSPLDLVRAEFTCRRWHHVIAAEEFHVLYALHGAPSSKVAGHYRVGMRLSGYRPPGRNPVFVPSSSSSWMGVAARNLALDFFPRTAYGDLIWELADVRGGLLLLLDFNHAEYGCSCAKLSCLIVCDPLARCYMMIPPATWFHGSQFLGAALLHGEDAGARISLSNFRVTCALYQIGIAKAYAFSSAPSGHGTSSGTTAHFKWVRYVNGTPMPIRFIGGNAWFGHWLVGVCILDLDKEAGELSSQEMSATVPGERYVLEHALELPWPPMFQASLS